MTTTNKPCEMLIGNRMISGEFQCCAEWELSSIKKGKIMSEDESFF